MSSLSGVGLLTSFGDRRDLVPVALRAAAGPGLCLLCCGRRADRRSGQAARRTTPQSCLRARLLDHVRNPGGERDNHRSTAPFLSPGGESGRRGIVLLLGLFMMGLVKLSWLQREFRLYLNVGGGRPVAAYIIGVAFAFGWTPCIGPVLGAILTTSTVAATVPQGVILLGFYSLGRRAVPRRIHRQSDAAARRSSSAWPKPTSRRGRNRRRPGHRDPDRRVDKLFLLAARHLPDPGKDRITQGRRSWTA